MVKEGRRGVEWGGEEWSGEGRRGVEKEGEEWRRKERRGVEKEREEWRRKERSGVEILCYAILCYVNAIKYNLILLTGDY